MLNLRLHVISSILGDFNYLCRLIIDIQTNSSQVRSYQMPTVKTSDGWSMYDDIDNMNFICFLF